MARMTVEMVGRCTGHTRRKRGESTESLLQRVTHLYCSERGISRIVSKFVYVFVIQSNVSLTLS